MNKDVFWQIIEQAKNDCKQDIEKVPDLIKEHLISLPPKDIVKFYNIYEKYMENAHTIGLWDAAIMMNKGCCSDDGFHYFKPWLIAQGKETYMNSLKHPDSLAGISASPTRYGYYELENMNYAAHEAYEELTDENIYETECSLTESEIADIKAEIEYEPTIDRPRKNGDILTYLPKLYARFAPRMSDPNEYHWNTNSDFFKDRIKYMTDHDRHEWLEKTRDFRQEI
jgi:hypothetical protein